MVELVDTHSHLAAPDFDADREAVLDRAHRAGVGAILVVGEGPEDNDRVLAVCREHPARLRPCLGLFPREVDLEVAREVGRLVERHAALLGAIGEVGLDYHLEAEPEARERQRAVLRYFADLAGRLDLPLTVHSRAAGRPAIELLRETGATRVILHAFDGRAVKALEGVEAGYFFSIPPSLLRSRQKEKLVLALPLEAILLESDAPVLGPVPDRRNEPANLVITLERIAELKGVPIERVAEVVVENQRRVFGTAP